LGLAALLVKTLALKVVIHHFLVLLLLVVAMVDMPQRMEMVMVEMVAQVAAEL
jgi:hypothetical protein